MQSLADVLVPTRDASGTMSLTTPQHIGESVELFRDRFSLPGAVWVPVQSRRDSHGGECYQDVEKQVREHGGELVYGWMIWEWPCMMIEGEFHAVWKSPSGELSDVTHKADGETRIVFIPDPVRVYQGRGNDNLRVALWDHALLHEFIKLSEQRLQMMDEGRVDANVFTVDREAFGRLEMRRAAIQRKLMSFPRARSNRGCGWGMRGTTTQKHYAKLLPGDTDIEKAFPKMRNGMALPDEESGWWMACSNHV